MQQILQFYKEWIRKALTQSIGAVDLWSGLVSAALSIFDHYFPGLQLMTSLGWEIPVWVLVGVMAVRLFLAPYWIWKEQQEEILNLRPERVAHCLGIPSISSTIFPGDQVQLVLTIENSANEAIEYGNVQVSANGVVQVLPARGWVIPRNRNTLFRTLIIAPSEPVGTFPKVITLDLQIDYGPPGRYSRRMTRNLQLIVGNVGQPTDWSVTAEGETAI